MGTIVDNEEEFDFTTLGSVLARSPIGPSLPSFTHPESLLLRSSPVPYMISIAFSRLVVLWNSEVMRRKIN